MKFLTFFIIISLLSIGNLLAQSDSELTRMRVHIVNANNALQSKNWDQAIRQVDQAQEILGKPAAIFESIRIKSYYGKKDYQKAKERVEVFYDTAPANNLIQEMAPIILDIDVKLEEQRKALERKREQERIAEVSRLEQIRIAEEKRLEQKRIEENIKRRSGTFVDSRDEKTYKTIQIGDQIWMAENLAYSPTSGRYWAYNNNSSNVTKYGYLYDWETASKVCPQGWRLPNDDDWEELVDYLGQYEGNKMKSTTGWQLPNTNNNSSGFSGTPGGRYSFETNSFEDGSNSSFRTGNWWSYTASGEMMASLVVLDKSYTINNYSETSKTSGLSVRCIKINRYENSLDRQTEFEHQTEKTQESGVSAPRSTSTQITQTAKTEKDNYIELNLPGFDGSSSVKYLGGMDGLLKEIQSHLTYPSLEYSLKIQGNVVVGATVTEEGKISDIKILQSASEGLDQEAIRVVKLLKNWKPAEKDGKPVSFDIQVPFKFSVD